MRIIHTALILSCFLAADGCTYTTFRDPSNRSHGTPEYLIVPYPKDSVSILPTTAYFYQCVLEDFKERNVNIAWVFGNLAHFGIIVDEAWYYEGSSHTDFGNGAHGNTIVHPALVVGLSEPNTDLLEHHFEQIQYFDSHSYPNGPESRFIHYVRSGSD